MSTINSYIVGNLIQISVSFVELIGKTPIDPETVTLYVKNPDCTIDKFTYEDGDIIRTGTGTYYYNLQNVENGYYFYRFEGGGNIIAATNGQFLSVASEFGSL